MIKMIKDESEVTSELTIRLDRETLNKIQKHNSTLKPSLIVVQGVDRGDAVTILQTPLVMGRGENCDYVIRDDGISRVHAQIVKDSNNVYTIEDLGSTNGIFIGNERIQSHQLQEGDKVLLGRRTILKFVYLDSFDEKYQKQMYESTVRDGLTGIYNRKHFDERIISELSYALRHKTPLSLLLVDLDHFKDINDTFGHQVGDQVIVQTAEKITYTLREEDFFARYGGEEFAILARNVDSTGATALGDRIRQIIQDMKVLTPLGLRVPVTLSMGIAALNGGTKMPPEALIKVADDNLYTAKQNGRNRVVTSFIA